MTATSAFPATRLNPLAPLATAILIRERFTHIPASYVRNPHMDPEEVIVTMGGKPILGMDGQSFTVAQVAPERRWAIQPNGEVLGPVDYKPAMQAVKLEYYAVLRGNGHPNAKFEGSIARESFPGVKDYVSFGVDPTDESKLVHIGYDRHRTDGARPERLATAEGELLSETRIQTLCNAYADMRARKRMTTGEIAEVEAHLGVSGGTADEVASKLDVLSELRASGDLSEAAYAEKIAALTGKAAQVARKIPTPLARKHEQQVELLAALCGKSVKGKRGKRLHEMNCKSCKGMRGES